MLINTYLDTEDFVHLYYPEDEPPASQGCGAGARMASKYPARPPSPQYTEVGSSSSDTMVDRCRAPPQPEPPPHRVRAADLYPRMRPHYDEPGLEIGFSTICGEFVMWVGCTADGGTISVSNYRLHTQPRRSPGTSVPLRLIDSIENSEPMRLVIMCKNGRQIKCTFSTIEQCAEWSRRLAPSLAPIPSLQDTFAAAYAAWAKEQPPSSIHRTMLKSSHVMHRHWFGPEVERMEFTTKGAWRVTAANAEYKLCASYPPLLVVPASIGDEDLDAVARFRALRRIPTAVWRHRGNGAVIARSSQPEVGWFGWRSSEDERLISAFVAACIADRGVSGSCSKQQLKILIMDARSYASAVTNRARGGGCECPQYYPSADIQFMCLPNIHHVRRSFQTMRALCADNTDQTMANWHSSLERTLWLQYVSGVSRAATQVARAVLAARPVLVHCSDGWDRTPQIVATAQLILDPHYRTVDGFRTLIEREWLDFGHKFADRCGHQFGADDPNERSPIFLQWLDVVHQLTHQYPCSFQFNEAYLIKLATHVHSCMFGTFLYNTSRERLDARTAESTAQVWHLLSSPAYRNHLYTPHTEQVLWPGSGVRHARVWWALFAGEEGSDQPPEPDLSYRPLPHQPPGLMTKTRSCDNLLTEGEKRTTQRRSSDPNIAPDVMKMSSVGGSALTDSCVDELPALPGPQHIAPPPVEGLHPDHFENSTIVQRDLTSGSSSLERELVGAVESAEAQSTVDSAADSVADSAADSAESESVAEANESDGADMVDSVIRVTDDTPEHVFVCDTYNDAMGMAEAAREVGRSRNISITWRSISESSNQSSTGFDLPDGPRAEPNSHEASPIDINNHNSTEGDEVNHNVVSELTNHNRQNGVKENGIERVPKFMDDMNGGTSSSISSESEVEGESGRSHVASQLTLCPASPRRQFCCHCKRRPSATSGLESGSSCACADPLDGLPPHADRLQARLQQIILHQQKIVEDLSEQLRDAKEALRRAGHAPAPAPPRHSPSAPSPTQMVSCMLGAASSSSSGSEVEVGEEARGVVWLPDSAAPRCQHCRNHFWLARRRHHCRRCGGIFCGSCSEMSSWGDCGGSVRLCRRCRALR